MICGLKVKQMAHICFLIYSEGNFAFISYSILIEIFLTVGLQARTIKPEFYTNCRSHAALTIFPSTPPETPPLPNPLKVPSQTRRQEGRRQEKVKAAVLTSLLQLKFI